MMLPLSVYNIFNDKIHDFTQIAWVKKLIIFVVLTNT